MSQAGSRLCAGTSGRIEGVAPAPHATPEPAVREEATMYVRNPVEWSLDQLKFAGSTLESLVAGRRDREDLRAPPVIRQIGIADIRDALAQGFRDFAAFRDDVVLICVIYPI